MGQTYMVQQAKKHPIEVEVPGSKSITNRALLIAALGEGTSTLRGVLFSDDSRHFIRALAELGFAVRSDEETRTVEVTGLGGRIPRAEASVDVGSAGTAARFLTAYLGLSGGRYHMDSSEQMKRRPMRELLEALAELGACVEYEEEEYHFPFYIESHGTKKHEVTVDVDKSSQFLSALLISAVLFDEDFVIRVTGDHGMAYVELTIAMMRQFGVEIVREEERTFRVPGSARYHAMEYEIEPDVSAAAYFYAMCPVLGVRVLVKHVHWQGLQGDIEFLRVLEQMGCGCEERGEGICMVPPADGTLRGGEFDLSAFSDQALTLAAIACFAATPVTICGIGHIRYQECDRVNAILHNLAAMGIDATRPTEDSITVEPGTPKPCTIATYDDHRVAMAFAIPGLVTPGVLIENPLCCGKTFENYFELLELKVCQ